MATLYLQRWARQQSAIILMERTVYGPVTIYASIIRRSEGVRDPILLFLNLEELALSRVERRTVVVALREVRHDVALRVRPPLARVARHDELHALARADREFLPRTLGCEERAPRRGHLPERRVRCTAGDSLAVDDCRDAV